VRDTIGSCSSTPYFSAQLDIKDPGFMLLLDYRKQNGKAYMLLSLSISPSDTITLNAVQNAFTTELPSGDAKQSWKIICEINLLQKQISMI
jgi:hypothetical protein